VSVKVAVSMSNSMPI